jgi:hypothetical protein
VAFGALTQLAAFGLVLIMFGAIYKTIFACTPASGRERLGLALRPYVHPDEPGHRFHQRSCTAFRCDDDICRRLLAPCAILLYASHTWGSVTLKVMHRLTARFLLLFAFLGSLAPLALAVTAEPPHACCLRRGIHHCHDSLAPESGQTVIQDASCCHGNCRRAATTAQWAHPQPELSGFSLHSNHARLVPSQSDSPSPASIEFQSTRAPPVG